MKDMLIFLFLLSFAATAQATPPLFTERKIEHGGSTFVDSAKITYAPDFNLKEFDQLIKKIGYVYPPNSTVEHIKQLNNKLMFKVIYHLGDYGLRLAKEKPSDLSYHFILAGDSNVFGEGCNDHETVTAHLNERMKDFRIYNFGHRGGGAHNTLSLLEHFPIKHLIAEKKGIFVYDLFASHMLERAIGAKNYIAWDNGLSPWYELNENDDVVFKGQFKDKTITSIYSFMTGKKWLNWLFPVLPQINDSHLHLIARMFVKMKQHYLKAFPEGRFFVLLNNSTMDDENAAKLKSELKRYNVETLNLPYHPVKMDAFIYQDMHFNPNGQKWQADLISDAVLKVF